MNEFHVGAIHSSALDWRHRSRSICDATSIHGPGYHWDDLLYLRFGPVRGVRYGNYVALRA